MLHTTVIHSQHLLGFFITVKGKEYQTREECSLGAHLPYVGLEPVGGLTT